MRTLFSASLLLLYLQQSTAQQEGTSQLFIVHFSLGPVWDHTMQPHEQQYYKEHSANLKRLREEGMLVIGARYADKGMLLLKAENEEAARSEIAKDPAVKNGIFTAEIHLFSPFYYGCIEQPTVGEGR